MRRALIVSLVAAGVLAGGAAYAQGPEHGAGMTRDKAEQRASTMFERLDFNKDGMLDSGDREARMADRFARIDANGDGSISPEEFAAMREQGRENRKQRRELAQNERGERRGEMRGQRGDRRGDAAGMRRGMQGRGLRGQGLAMLGQADTDADGAISKNEFTTRALERFDTIDADKNGTISREERRAARPAGLRARPRQADG